MKHLEQAEMGHSRLLEVAREYRDKGYEVHFEPQAADLPDFLVPYQPALIARSDKESVVVEMKFRDELVGNNQMMELARLLETKPGWRLDLLIEPARQDLRLAPKDLLTEVEIQRRLNEIVDLEQTGHIEAAVLLGWSAVEGALRLLASSEQIKPPSASTLALVKQLYVEGLLSLSQYDLLRRYLEFRSQVAHGLKARELPAGVVNQLRELGHELLTPAHA